MNIIDISRDALKTEIYPGDPLPHAELVRGAAVKISLAAALYEQAFAFLRELFVDILDLFYKH